MSRWICNVAGSFKRYLVAAALALGGSAYAATFTFDNATLDLDEPAWTFSLSTNDWPAAFGPSAFIGSMVVDFSDSSSGVAVVDGSVSGGGVTAVSTADGSGPGGQFDFRFRSRLAEEKRRAHDELARVKALKRAADLCTKKPKRFARRAIA